MTLKSKLGLLAAGTVIAVGTTYAAAQTRTSQTLVKPAVASPTSPQHKLSLDDQSLLLSLLNPEFSTAKKLQLAELTERWSPAYIAPTLEIFNFIPDREIRRALLKHLSESTGQSFGRDINAWYRWLWNEPEIKVAGYDNFKAEFYSAIDPKFAKYFRNRGNTSQIRLDEIRWGGVVQDGIPPLRQPKMLRAKDADYLEDDNVISQAYIVPSAELSSSMKQMPRVFPTTLAHRAFSTVLISSCMIKPRSPSGTRLKANPFLVHWLVKTLHYNTAAS